MLAPPEAKFFGDEFFGIELWCRNRKIGERHGQDRFHQAGEHWHAMDRRDYKRPGDQSGESSKNSQSVKEDGNQAEHPQTGC